MLNFLALMVCTMTAVYLYFTKGWNSGIAFLSFAAGANFICVVDKLLL